MNDADQSIGQNSYYTTYTQYGKRYGSNKYDINRCILWANLCMLILILILSVTICTIVSIQYKNISSHMMTGNHTTVYIDENILNTTNLKFKILLYMIPYNE
jgi:uncharacterized membrane protein YjgN (DUF898 family)